jgi:hypothetical protein
MREVGRKTLSLLASRDSLSLRFEHDELGQNLNGWQSARAVFI